VSDLEKSLEKRFNRGFSRRYIAKVADQVARRALVDIDRMKIEERLDFTRNNYRMMREELLKLVYWNHDTAPAGVPKPLARDRIEAAKNVVMMDLALLSAEIANGCIRNPSRFSLKSSDTIRCLMKSGPSSLLHGSAVAYCPPPQ
jgi:hypothetical protein